MKKIRAVIIGMGRMGKTRYDAMMRHGGYEVTGICDTNPANMEGYSEPKFSDWKECIDQSVMDAVIVCTYNVLCAMPWGKGMLYFPRSRPEEICQTRFV